MNVAVVGGGLFGVTAAVELDAAGHTVDLYEARDGLLQEASWANQWRMHHGYHYPRSESTAQACRRAAKAFRERFGEAVLDDAAHHYCIAARDTKTTGEEYLEFCDQLGLEYERHVPDVIDPSRIDLSVRVPEARIDPHCLRDRCREDIRDSGVSVHLGRRVTDTAELPHEAVVVATYARTNDLLAEHDSLLERYKFELCEKPVVELPPSFDGVSAVVMDGPFMCLDPYGRTDRHLLGDVVYAVHERQEGLSATFEDYEHLLGAGIVEAPSVTRFGEFVDHGREFFPRLTEAEHVGSLFAVRTVLAGVEATDERPTMVEREGRVLKVFAGKLTTCVPAARAVVERVERGR